MLYFFFSPPLFSLSLPYMIHIVVYRELTVEMYNAFYLYLTIFAAIFFFHHLKWMFLFLLKTAYVYTEWGTHMDMV